MKFIYYSTNENLSNALNACIMKEKIRNINCKQIFLQKN